MVSSDLLSHNRHVLWYRISCMFLSCYVISYHPLSGLPPLISNHRTYTPNLEINEKDRSSTVQVDSAFKRHKAGIEENI